VRSEAGSRANRDGSNARCDVALDHVAERIDDSAYLERLGQVRVDLATVDTTARGDLSARRAGQGPFVPLSRSRLRTGCSALLG
jgi:hypothetical protein